MKFKLVLLFALALVVLAWYTYDSLKPPFKPGQAAPDFALTDLKGDTVRLSDFLGQPVLIHFWATWCGQCAAEMPSLSTLDKNYPQIKVLAVSEDEGGAQVIKAFFGNVLPPYNILLDTNGTVADLYKSYKVPESYLLNSRGEFLHRFLGAVDWNDPKIIEFVKKF